MKARIFSLLLALGLLCSAPAHAMTPPVLDGGHTEEGPFVLCAEYDQPDDAHWPYIKKLFVLEADEELTVPETDTPAANALPAQMAYVCEGGGTRNVDVVWDTTDEALAQPGLHQITGYPVIDEAASLAAGYLIIDENTSFAEGYDGKVTWPVFRKGGQPLEAVSLQKPLLANRLIPLSGDASGLSISTSGRFWGAAGTDGFLLTDDSWTWEWDYSQVDASKEGAYTITGTLEPPEWISANDVYKISQDTVYVLPTDRIEIYAAVETRPTKTSGQVTGGELVIKWLYDSANVTEAALQRMDESGQWVDCDSSWYRYDKPNKFVESLTAKLRLLLHKIPTVEEHRLRLRYLDVVDGQIVERFTEPITLTIPENILELLAAADGGVPEDLDIGGDPDEDDFGDQGEKVPAGTIIPAPEDMNRR